MLKEIKLPENYKYISAFLTMRCNLRCSYCLNSLSSELNRTKFKEISGNEWVEALNKIEPKPNLPITFSGGEPFLHPDFNYIINNLKPEFKIDILTNLSYLPALKKFIQEVNPEKITRDSPYPSIRVSYHPQQMDAEKLVETAKMFQDAGFKIGIYGVLYPSSQHLSLLNQMQFICRNNKIDFRIKEFTGKYKDELYGDYSKYPGSVLKESLKNCLCKTSELLIAPDGNVYRCHRDLYSEQFPIGNITSPSFQVEDKFRECSFYGNCHPCDVKVKTNFKQELGHTSVEIRDVKE